ncbi:MAG: hypothetical protein HAW61_05615, partial [Candidatus Portiera sp.]|nr:hypothetical protein [Portiera sp.]
MNLLKATIKAKDKDKASTEDKNLNRQGLKGLRGLIGYIQQAPTQLARLIGLLIITTALAACGGGGGSDGTPNPDLDGDGILNAADNCPLVANPGQENVAGMDLTKGDACDDEDADTVFDAADNCPLVANPDQNNIDGDALGDACDDDIDGDTVVDAADNCPLIVNPGQSDLDGGGGGDVCDMVNDNDADNSVDAFDVDADGDGLIEIHNVATLDAVRNNLAGTGLNLTGAESDSTGCGATTADVCTGYELMADLDLNDLDVLASGDFQGSNWEPIGVCVEDSCEETFQFFAGNFNGNDHIINNLDINTAEAKIGVGLFGAVAYNVEISNVHLRNVNIMAP